MEKLAKTYFERCIQSAAGQGETKQVLRGAKADWQSLLTGNIKLH